MLTLLYAGLALGLTHSPRVQWRIIKGLAVEWGVIEPPHLVRTARSLYDSKLITAQPNADGSYTVMLTTRGKKEAARFHISEMQIRRPLRWDKKWRLITYDIPEKKAHLRHELARRLEELGFYELQRSVWVHPFECEKELSFLLKLYDAEKYVNVMLVEKIQNDIDLRHHFDLV